jgi:hypothetical protein
VETAKILVDGHGPVLVHAAAAVPAADGERVLLVVDSTSNPGGLEIADLGERSVLARVEGTHAYPAFAASSDGALWVLASLGPRGVATALLWKGGDSREFEIPGFATCTQVSWSDARGVFLLDCHRQGSKSKTGWRPVGSALIALDPQVEKTELVTQTKDWTLSHRLSPAGDRAVLMTGYGNPAGHRMLDLSARLDRPIQYERLPAAPALQHLIQWRADGSCIFAGDFDGDAARPHQLLCSVRADPSARPSTCVEVPASAWLVSRPIEIPAARELLLLATIWEQRRDETFDGRGCARLDTMRIPDTLDCD